MEIRRGNKVLEIRKEWTIDEVVNKTLRIMADEFRIKIETTDNQLEEKEGMLTRSIEEALIKISNHSRTGFEYNGKEIEIFPVLFMPNKLSWNPEMLNRITPRITPAWFKTAIETRGININSVKKVTVEIGPEPNIGPEPAYIYTRCDCFYSSYEGPHTYYANNKLCFSGDKELFKKETRSKKEDVLNTINLNSLARNDFKINDVVVNVFSIHDDKSQFFKVLPDTLNIETKESGWSV